jgi:hypothetical protein
VTIPPKLFELPTEAVDNSVNNLFLSSLTIGFYYIFVTLNNFKPVIIFTLFSIG